jgi:hypothetical protein
MVRVLAARGLNSLRADSTLSRNEREDLVTAVTLSASLSWCQAPIRDQ